MYCNGCPRSAFSGYGLFKENTSCDFQTLKAPAKSWIHKRVKLFAPPCGAASDASPLYRNSFEKNSY